jgi:hypothetical protein
MTFTLLEVLFFIICLAPVLVVAGMCVAPQRKRPEPRQHPRFDYCYGDIPNIIPLKGHSERYFTKMDGR